MIVTICRTRVITTSASASKATRRSRAPSTCHCRRRAKAPWRRFERAGGEARREPGLEARLVDRLDRRIADQQRGELGLDAERGRLAAIIGTAPRSRRTSPSSGGRISSGEGRTMSGSTGRVRTASHSPCVVRHQRDRRQPRARAGRPRHACRRAARRWHRRASAAPPPRPGPGQPFGELQPMDGDLLARARRARPRRARTRPRRPSSARRCRRAAASGRRPALAEEGQQRAAGPGQLEMSASSRSALAAVGAPGRNDERPPVPARHARSDRDCPRDRWAAAGYSRRRQRLQPFLGGRVAPIVEPVHLDALLERARCRRAPWSPRRGPRPA